MLRRCFIALAVSEDLFHWKRLGLATFEPYRGIDFVNVDNKDASVFPIAIPNHRGKMQMAILHRPLFRGTRPEETARKAPSHVVDLDHESIWISYCPMALVRQWINSYLEIPQWAFNLLFHLLPWLVLFYGLIMIYKLAPSRPTKFSEIWLGALGATILIWLGEMLFLVYWQNFSSFNVLYGALGGIVAFLLWVYLSACVAVCGICVCAAQAEIHDKALQPSEHKAE